MAAAGDRTRVLKGGLLVIGILILGGIIVMFSRNRQQAPSDQSGISTENRNETIALEGIHHTDIRNGMKYLELDAESGDWQLEENSAYLTMLDATFFEDDGERVFLSAESGTWMRDSNDLEVSGNVVLKNSQCEMQTDDLIFNENEQIFVTESHVEMCCLSLCQEADGMTFSRDTGKFELHRNIRGKIGNGIGP